MIYLKAKRIIYSYVRKNKKDSDRRQREIKIVWFGGEKYERKVFFWVVRVFNGGKLVRIKVGGIAYIYSVESREYQIGMWFQEKSIGGCIRGSDMVSQLLSKDLFDSRMDWVGVECEEVDISSISVLQSYNRDRGKKEKLVFY